MATLLFREGKRFGWLGGSDYRTSPSCFEYDGLVSYGPYASSNNRVTYRCYLQAFNRVLRELHKLEGQGLVALIYYDVRMLERRLVAYRFTSDEAYNQHSSRLVSLGSSLGRGTWDPFHDKYQFSQWLSPEAHALGTNASSLVGV